MLRLLLGLALIILISPGCSADTRDSEELSAHYEAQLRPDSDSAQITITIAQQRRDLREISFSLESAPNTKPSVTSGRLTGSDEQWNWKLSKTGGQISYTIDLSHRRQGGDYDALATDKWVLTRLENLFPSTHNRSIKGSRAATTMTISAPQGWSTLTRYGREDKERATVISNSARTLPRPTGWLLSGDLGTRTDKIADRSVTVAAPKGSGYQRVPMLAFLRWTLPELNRVFPTLPDRVLIVSGDDRMWRGGLSGPGSLYLHKDRPLISENATSTPIHELIHIATRWRAAPGDDWIVEGIAEYYSLKILRNSEGISKKRFENALQELQAWSTSERGKLSDPSKGVDTAFAVNVFKLLDDEMANSSGPIKLSLDDVVRDLLENQTGSSLISRARLIDSVTKLLKRPSTTLLKFGIEQISAGSTFSE